MTKFFAAKHLGSLRAIDQAGEEIIGNVGQGEIVQLEIKRPRNIKHHRMYWALVTLVHENLDGDRYKTADDLHAALKVAAGIGSRIVLPSNEVVVIPGSIAFHKMDQTAFDEFYDRICDLIAKHFLPGVTKADLKNEVALLIGAK
jgi:hypothetical protein